MPPDSGATLCQEEAHYGEVLRYDAERNVMVSEGVKLRSFSSPKRWRHWWVNRMIRLGVANPLREDLSGMSVTEERVRQAMISEGMIPEDYEGSVLVRHG